MFGSLYIVPDISNILCDWQDCSVHYCMYRSNSISVSIREPVIKSVIIKSPCHLLKGLKTKYWNLFVSFPFHCQQHNILWLWKPSQPICYTCSWQDSIWLNQLFLSCKNIFQLLVCYSAPQYQAALRSKLAGFMKILFIFGSVENTWDRLNQ